MNRSSGRCDLFNNTSKCVTENNFLSDCISFHVKDKCGESYRIETIHIVVEAINIYHVRVAFRFGFVLDALIPRKWNDKTITHPLETNWQRETLPCAIILIVRTTAQLSASIFASLSQLSWIIWFIARLRFEFLQCWRLDFSIILMFFVLPIWIEMKNYDMIANK